MAGPDFNRQVKLLGQKLSSLGMVYQGEALAGGLLQVVLDNAPVQAGNKANTGQGALTTGEYQDYLIRMGQGLGKAAAVIGQDHENPHAAKIAEGMAKTADYLQNLAMQEEARIISTQQAERNLERQAEAFRQRRKKEQEISEPERESLGVLDALVKNIVLSRQLGEIAKGMDGCSLSEGKTYNETPYVGTSQEKGHGMPFPARKQ